MSDGENVSGTDEDDWEKAETRLDDLTIKEKLSVSEPAPPKVAIVPRYNVVGDGGSPSSLSLSKPTSVPPMQRATKDEVDSAVLSAMANPRERMGVLTIENTILTFVKSSERTVELPPGLNSFRRLLTYRIGQRFGLSHSASDTANEYGERGIILYKTPDTCIPMPLLIDIDIQAFDPAGGGSGGGSPSSGIDMSPMNSGKMPNAGTNVAAWGFSTSRSGGSDSPAGQVPGGVGVGLSGSAGAVSSAPPQRKVKVMKRNKSANDSQKTKVLTNKKQQTAEDRERAYQEARARIFGDESAAAEAAAAAAASGEENKPAVEENSDAKTESSEKASLSPAKPSCDVKTETVPMPSIAGTSSVAQTSTLAPMKEADPVKESQATPVAVTPTTKSSSTPTKPLAPGKSSSSAAAAGVANAIKSVVAKDSSSSSNNNSAAGNVDKKPVVAGASGAATVAVTVGKGKAKASTINSSSGAISKSSSASDLVATTNNNKTMVDVGSWKGNKSRVRDVHAERADPDFVRRNPRGAGSGVGGSARGQHQQYAGGNMRGNAAGGLGGGATGTGASRQGGGLKSSYGSNPDFGSVARVAPGMPASVGTGMSAAGVGVSAAKVVSASSSNNKHLNSTNKSGGMVAIGGVQSGSSANNVKLAASSSSNSSGSNSNSALRYNIKQQQQQQQQQSTHGNVAQQVYPMLGADGKPLTSTQAYSAMYGYHVGFNTGNVASPAEAISGAGVSTTGTSGTSSSSNISTNNNSNLPIAGSVSSPFLTMLPMPSNPHEQQQLQQMQQVQQMLALQQAAWNSGVGMGAGVVGVGGGMGALPMPPLMMPYHLGQQQQQQAGGVSPTAVGGQIQYSPAAMVGSMVMPPANFGEMQHMHLFQQQQQHQQYMLQHQHQHIFHQQIQHQVQVQHAPHQEEHVQQQQNPPPSSAASPSPFQPNQQQLSRAADGSQHSNADFPPLS